MTTNTKLGTNQRYAIKSLATFRRWPGGWVMGTPSQTVRVLDSLVRKGLVSVSEEVNPIFKTTSRVWRLTKAGKAVAEVEGKI